MDFLYYLFNLILQFITYFWNIFLKYILEMYFGNIFYDDILWRTYR